MLALGPVIQVQDLSVHYHVPGRGVVRAVDGVSFTVNEGETVALVGESGCGKSTVGRAILGLLPFAGGSATFSGVDLATLRPGEWKAVRRQIAMIFQDPFASLDPRWRIGAIVAEPLMIHALARGKAALMQAAELLNEVGIEERMLNRFPHELSGGQRQRVAIARALATRPKLVIADEPTAALDTSIRAQILNLLRDLQDRLGIAFLFISHDLSTVQYLSHRVAVMYLGKIVETTGKSALFGEPMHPYTRALLASVPPPTATGKLPPVLGGEVPDPFHIPSGCRFRTRCSFAQSRCTTDEPQLRNLNGSWAACHFAEEIAARHATQSGEG